MSAVPLYVAVIVFDPDGNAFVINTARPLVAVARVTTPSVVLPEVNVTVPVGAVPRLVATVAIRSIARPALDGFTSNCKLTTDGAAVRVCVSDANAAFSVALPAYLACNASVPTVNLLVVRKASPVASSVAAPRIVVPL